MLNIKYAPLTFKRDHTTRSKTEVFVIHHSASPAATTTIFDIQSWHLAKGWYGIGYHFVIYPNGDIYQGRPEWAVGAHAYQDAQHQANTNGIGICLIGDFTKERPTEAQMKSLILLITYLRGLYGKKPVIGHKDVMPTQCPGPNFPWSEINSRLEGKEVEDWKKEIMKKGEAAGLIDPGKHQPTEPAEKWFVIAVALDVLAKKEA